MQIVFLGTPELAVPTLDALVNHSDFNVVAVITQPDRQSGRGQKMHAPPVKVFAEKHQIPVFQPEKLRKAKDVVEKIKSINPDLIVMVAFGQILKSEFLAITKLGVINLHFSLLPAYRGAAPLNWAIINGDTISGISTMFTEAGLDTGPILLQEEIAIDSNINAEQLGKTMSVRGANLVIQTIKQLQNGNLIPSRQDESKATYAPLLSKSISCIKWSQPAQVIHNLIRGLVPWPVAFTSFNDQPLKIWQSQLLTPEELRELVSQYGDVEPGTIKMLHKRLFASCGAKDWIELKEVQPANKAKLEASAWANGIRLQPGNKFST